jgi:hypothetical protein
MLRLLVDASQSLLDVTISYYYACLGGLVTTDRKSWSHKAGQAGEERALQELALELSLR